MVWHPRSYSRAGCPGEDVAPPQRWRRRGPFLLGRGDGAQLAESSGVKAVMEVPRARTEGEAKSFGKYRFIAALGSGGMAVVHLAVVHGPSGFNKLVVLKQIHPEYSEDPEILGMFLDEARLAARLSHPNVVQTNEVGHEGERHFMAMEYLDGQPLSRVLRRLQRHGGLPLVMHLQVIADTLGGLHHAHELADYDGSPLGVVHRDVNPQNVFVTYDGAVKVVDFGIAKARNAVTHTRDGMVRGKVAYMAPEQVLNDRVDRRADIFAAGVMLWEAATGARPWKGVAEPTMMKALLAGEFPAARGLAPEIAEPLEAMIRKALSLDRRDRYATAAELQGAIEAYLETLGGRLPPRELGKLLSTHFAEERAEIRSLIEEQRRGCNGAATEATLPVPVLGRGIAGEEDSGERRESITAADSQPHLESAGASRPTVLSCVPAMPAPPPRRRGRLLAFAGAILAFAVVVPLALTLGKAPPASASTAAQPRVSVAAAATIPSTVELRISAAPAFAQIFLDDALLAGNPFRGAFPRDERAHRIRVEAPGFVPRVEIVALDSDRVLDIEMASELDRPGPLPASTSVARPGRPHEPKGDFELLTNPYTAR